MRVQYVLGEAFRNMGRNALVVLGAVLAVFVSLFLTFSTLLFGEVVRVNTVKWSSDVRVEAYVSDDLDGQGVQSLQETIAGWDDVLEVKYVSKSEALEIARELFKDEPSQLEVVEQNPAIIPASFRIKPADLKDYDGIVSRLEGTRGVERVASAGDAVDRITALRDGLRIFSWVLAVALGVAAVALIANTIHMAVYARREEIEIMKLVGASNWFVRTPFLLEGMLEGFLGALLAVALAIGVYRLGESQLDGLPDFIDLTIGRNYMVKASVLILVFGVVVGAVGSAISLAVHRYIRT
jgi:cell division transport system permease protein